MLTGKELFLMYVREGLCVGSSYKWEELSDYRRARWCDLADKLRKIEPVPFTNERIG